MNAHAQALGALLTCALAACGAPGTARLSAAETAAVLRLSPLPPLPPDPTNRVADDPRAALLGQALFFDAGLSADGRTSCASCHDPARAFTDGRAVALAVGEGRRNTPTVLNSAYNRWFFRDGRTDSAWAQALQPIEDPLEMANTRAAVAEHLASDARLAEAFAQLFGALPSKGEVVEAAPDSAVRERTPADHGIDAVFAQVGKAIAAYERRLLSGAAPFDRYVAALRRGDPDGGGHLSAQAIAGLQLFVGAAGCVRCHAGPLLSDGEFHNLGVPPRGGGAPRDSGRYDGLRRLAADPFAATGAHSDAPDGERARELGRLLGGPEQWGAFQTPSLRNVQHTAPYMHAGQFATLHEVLHFYSTLEGAVGAGHHGESTLQPLQLEPAQVEALVAFLCSLGDLDLPRELLAPPRSG